MGWLKEVSVDWPTYMVPFATIGTTLLFLLCASLAHRSSALKMFGCFAALAGIGGLAWLYFDLRDAREGYLSDLVRFEDHLYAEQTRLEEAKQRLQSAVIPAITAERKDLRQLLYMMQDYDAEAFERFSNAVLTQVGQGDSFWSAFGDEYGLYKDMIDNGLAAANDEILTGMSIYYRDFFKAIPRDKPVFCSYHLAGQDFGPADDNSARVYYAMYTMLFKMIANSPSESAKSLATTDEALSFAKNIWGAEKFDRIVDGTAPSAEVCESLADLYGSILTDNAEKSGGLMRQWAWPARVLEHARKG